MKLQSILRTQLLAAGLGATLLLASSAKAQEITNSEFADGPYVVPFSQPLASEDTALPPSAPVMTESQALQALTAISTPSIPDQLDTSQLSLVERWVTALLLLLASLLALLVLVELSLLVELKRSRRNARSGQEPVSTHAA